MLNIKLFGDKRGERFIWSIVAIDSRGTRVDTDGIDFSEGDAKACMHAALGALLEKLEVFACPTRMGREEESRAGYVFWRWPMRQLALTIF